MTAMTPLFCLRVKDLELYTQDYAGIRTFVCTASSQAQLEWLVGSLVVFHRTKVLQWDDPDSKAQP